MQDNSEVGYEVSIGLDIRKLADICESW